VNGSLAETSTLFTKAEDKNNSRLNRRLMGRFKAALDELELMELPLHGRKFTWTSSHSSQSEVTMTRIDKMFNSLGGNVPHGTPSCLGTTARLSYMGKQRTSSIKDLDWKPIGWVFQVFRM
jgi:hypothetical protein